MRGSTRIQAVIVLLSLAGLLALSAWSAQTPDEAAQVPAEVPEKAKQLQNPWGVTPESIANGRLVYSSQCVMCHGDNGNGKGDLAIQFKYEIADLRTAEAQKARTDGEWFFILTNGHGKMSGEGARLKDKVRWDLVNYLRTLGPKPAA